MPFYLHFVIRVYPPFSIKHCDSRYFEWTDWSLLDRQPTSLQEFNDYMTMKLVMLRRVHHFFNNLFRVVNLHVYYKSVDPSLGSALAPVLEGSGSRRLYPRKGTSVDRVSVVFVARVDR